MTLDSLQNISLCSPRLYVVYTHFLSSDFAIGQLFVFNWIWFRTKKDRQLSLERKELQNYFAFCARSYVVYTPCLSSDFSIGQLFVFTWIGFQSKDRQLSLERKELQNYCIPPNKNKSKKGLSLWRDRHQKVDHMAFLSPKSSKAPAQEMQQSKSSLVWSEIPGCIGLIECLTWNRRYKVGSLACSDRGLLLP